MRRRPLRRLRRSAVVSVLLNLLGFAILGQVFWVHEAKPEKMSVSETVTIEKVVHKREARAKASSAAPPVPVVAKIPLPPQEPKPVPVPVVHRRVVVVPPVEESKPVPKAVRKIVTPAVVASVQSKPAALAGPKRYSDRQIANIEASLGASIAHDRDKENPLAGASTASGPEMKHYGMDVSNLTAGGLNHHGLCSPIKTWVQDGWNYYYLTCNVEASDGTYDTESIPWPVRYRPNADPNVGTAPGNEPIAMPLPGWHLTPGVTVADGVRQYAEAHGVSF